MIDDRPDDSASPPGTFAVGVRRRFADQPTEIRDWVAEVVGAPVLAVRDCVGGMAPGTAAVVRGTEREAFVKIASSWPNATSLQLYRDERRRLRALPRHPAIVHPLAATDLEAAGQTYAITVFPAIPGAIPTHPWTAADAERVFTTLGEVATALAAHRLPPSAVGPDPDLPDSTGLMGFFGHWEVVLADAADPWAGRRELIALTDAFCAADDRVRRDCVGDTPAHCDLRADNVLIDDDRVWLVDWAGARRAAPWVDPAILACDLAMSGADTADGGGFDLWAFLRTHPVPAAVDPALLWATMAGIAATLHHLSRMPAVPGLPTIRAWQHRCAEKLLTFVVRSATTHGSGSASQFGSDPGALVV